MEFTVKHLTMQELEAALDHLREAPKDEGLLQLIVCRPNVDQREILHEAELDPLKSFIVPGGSPKAAALHVARTVCRRAERRVVELGEADQRVTGGMLHRERGREAGDQEQDASERPPRLGCQ